MDRRRFIGTISTAGGSAITATFAASKDTHSPSQNSQSIKYAVNGFTCVTCAVGLEVLLRKQRGVTSANASYPERNVVIGFDRNLTSPTALKNFIAQCGFSVVGDK